MDYSISVLHMKNPFGRMAALALPAISLVVICGYNSVAGAQNFSGSPHSGSGYTPQRVYDGGSRRFTDFETMLAELARLDVVFVGEQHDDPNTHRLERAILEGLARRRPNLVVAMEMFERDVQAAIDDYLARRTSEEEFLKSSRPWRNYPTDYRPIVEFARAHSWRVVAANAPTTLSRQVARGGLAALDAMPAEDRANLAREFSCPLDDYYKRFAETMTSHPGATAHGSGSAGASGAEQKAEQQAIIQRYYQAQCIKDETMAESVARLYDDAPQPRPLTVHFNGAFHSDYRMGAAARTRQRMPKAAIRVVTIVPVENLDAVRPDEYRKRGDYIVFTLRPFKPGAEPAPGK